MRRDSYGGGSPNFRGDHNRDSVQSLSRQYEIERLRDKLATD